MRRVEPATISNGCKALPGDVVYTMKRLGGDSFELTELVYTYSSSMAGGGERGDGCTRGPGKPAQTRVTISAGGSLQIFCSYAQQTVCFSCVEAKDAAGNASRPSCATLRVR